MESPDILYAVELFDHLGQFSVHFIDYLQIPGVIPFSLRSSVLAQIQKVMTYHV